MTAQPSSVEELLDRQAIADLLVRYCHAIDRLDRDLLESVYWPDATDDHITYSGSAAGFIDWVLEFLRPFVTQHFIGNSLIEFDSPDRARGVTYVNAFHRLPTKFGKEDFLVGARYFDTITKRNGEWRLSDRILTIDYSKLSMANETSRYDSIENRGGRYPEDPFYRLFSK